MGGIHCLSPYLVYVFFCDVQAAFGAFYRIGKQPAHYGFVEFAFQMAFGGKFGFGNSACG